jgi:hypothetical protein
VNAQTYVIVAYAIGLGLLVGYAVLLALTSESRAARDSHLVENNKESEVNHGDFTRRT